MFLKELLGNVQPLDLIAFHGRSLFSRAIEEVEELSCRCNTFSHVGIVVNSDILPVAGMKQNVWYIWESTVGFKIPSVETEKVTWGCQIRPLDEVITQYLSVPGQRVAWCQLKKNPWDTRPKEVRDVMVQVHRALNRSCYDFGVIDLFAAAFQPVRLLRRVRDGFWNLLYATRLMSRPECPVEFCSELVSFIYENLGIIEKINCRDVTPSDFFDGVISVNESPVFIET